LLVLVTATNFYLKGVLKVLQAMAQLDEEARKKFRVVITGQIPDVVFQNYINQHQLQDVCRLAGWVEDIDLYYQAADIFLHPTYHDAGSLSTLKALAAGTAVVTSRFDGSAEWITNGVHGLVLEQPENTSELAATLCRLLDAPWRKKLGEAARQTSPLFAQERQFKKLEEIYFRLRSHRKPDA
jgi:UDP-glucose:(heptosyl)LPS alpha-1,3-glucosyltransferase